MTAEERDVLIEAATGAFRERGPSGEILPSCSWMDLSPEDRDRLFAAQLESRLLERSLDPRALSTTAHAVLDRVPLLGQFPPP